MAKTKSDKSAKAGPSSKSAEVKAITSVKEGAVTKPSQTPKAKSQEMAKQVALKADLASNSDKKVDKKPKKVVKEPTPEASSDESDEEEDDASSDSSESSDSDKEAAPPAAKVNGKLNGKANGVSNGAAHSDSSESSDSSDDEEAPAPTKPAATAAAGADSAQSDSDDDSEASDSDSDEEAPADKGPIDAKKLTGALTKVASKEGSEADSDESNDSDASDSGDDSSSSESEDEAPQKKRKADAEPAAPVKKAKKEEASKNGGDGIRNLFVGSLSWSVDEEWLTREFEEFGELSGVRIITDKATGRSKGFGYVEYVNAADAAKAHDAMKGKMIDNREINIDFSVPRNTDSGAATYQNRSNDRAKTYGDQVSEPSETLFVGNISFEATEDIVGEEFGKFGSVQSVRLPTDQETGNPKGFGYVQFASIEDAKAAFEGMKGAAICGRPIRLDYGRPRAANGDSPGGRGGRGGFSRGDRGGDRGGRGGGRGRGGFGDRGGRGGSRGGRGGSTNRGGFGDFQGKKMTF